MDSVFIKGLEVSAKHGVLAEEKTNAQKFIFDAEIYCDFTAAARSDELSDTVNYSAACAVISSVAEGNVFNLVEKLAYECAAALLDAFPKASGVEMTVYKPDAPVRAKFGTVGARCTLKRVRAYLSLGSSLGDRRGYLDRALSMLGATRGVEVTKVSSYLDNPPEGGAAKNDFLNCAAEVVTYLPARALLDEAHRIEDACGRTREVRRGDRTLDIDVIFYGDEKICEEGLIIPHPLAFSRNFVLIPLKEIAPHLFCGDGLR